MARVWWQVKLHNGLIKHVSQMSASEMLTVKYYTNPPLLTYITLLTACIVAE